MFLLILLVGQQVADVGLNSIWGTAFDNALHLPWFAVLTALLLWWSRRWRIKGRARWLVIVSAMLFGALGSELVNELIGRDAQLQDVVRDLLGGGATLLGWFAIRTSGWHRWLAICAAVILIVAGLAELLTATSQVIAKRLLQPVLFDPAGYYSKRFATAVNATSLAASSPRVWRLRFDTGEWQGFELRDPAPDWRGYTQLCLRLDVADDQPLTLLVRVHDVHHAAHHYALDDRFNRHLTLPSGRHLIDIKLHDIAHAPTGRLLDMTAIASLSVHQLPPFTPGRLLDVGAIWLSRNGHCVLPSR